MMYEVGTEEAIFKYQPEDLDQFLNYLLNSLPKEKFDKIGLFDENYILYFEEIDLCRRLRKSKKKIYLDQSIKINHIGGSSHNQLINFDRVFSFIQPKFLISPK